MARRKIIPDYEIAIARKEIESGKISLRGKAKLLGVHPSSLADRIKKWKNGDITNVKPDTMPDKLKVNEEVKPDSFKLLPDIIKERKHIVGLKPDIKPDKMSLTTETLRQWYWLLTYNPTTNQGKGHRGKRNDCIDLIIEELKKRKLNK